MKTRRKRKLLKIYETKSYFYSTNYLHKTKFSICHYNHLRVLSDRGQENFGMHHQQVLFEFVTTPPLPLDSTVSTAHYTLHSCFSSSF